MGERTRGADLVGEPYLQKIADVLVGAVAAFLGMIAMSQLTRRR